MSTRKAHNRLKLDEVKLAKMYSEGYSVTYIAKEFNVSYPGIKNRVDELNLLKPLKKIKRKSPLVKELDIEEIIRLYSTELLPVDEIAKIFNVNHGTINLRLKNSGIVMRTIQETQTIAMNKPEVKQKISYASKKSAEQRIKTNLEKYGVSVPSNNQEKNIKWKSEYLKIHGIEWNKDPARTNKLKKTNLEKYGVDNISKLPVIKTLIQQNRWTNKSEEELNDIKNKSNKTFFKNNTKDKVASNLKNLNIILLNTYINSNKQYLFKCLVCKNEFRMSWNNLKYRKCPVCNPINPNRISKGEKEICDYIKTLNINFSENTKYIISPQELDIYIPTKKIAIEFNGLYWHSELSPNKISWNYHLNKTLECEKHGIQLIHIFEDEWIFKQDIVKARLAQILGVSNNKRIHARKCIIKEIIPSVKNEFLEKFHIQGKDSSVVKLGAFYQEELVSVMTFSHGNISRGSKPKAEVWELNRFCSHSYYHIPGIASKLLTHFKRNFEWKEIFTYADRRWSIGNVYYKLGFDLDKITSPNYFYVDGVTRLYRWGLQKRPDEPKDIPEWMLRQQEGLYRIWDCGNLKFKMIK